MKQKKVSTLNVAKQKVAKLQPASMAALKGGGITNKDSRPNNSQYDCPRA